jgi:DNA ligase (NAD+)
MTNIDKLAEREALYIKAKEMYYNEEPIMEDSAFDELEQWLKDNGSEVVKKVGSWDRKAKFPHPSKMGSLEKIQADKSTGEAPWELFKAWYDNIKSVIGKDLVTIEWSQKLDGNAVNLVYENGILTKALSRGDGILGRDYLSRIDKTQIPLSIPITDNIVEVRCEAVIEKRIFAEKYARLPELTEEENAKRFSNERNYVAGLLNNDDATSEQISEIHLIPVEMHEVLLNGKIIYWDINDIRNWGFAHYKDLCLNYEHLSMTKEKFERVFKEYEDFKHNESPYRLDGMVAKINSSQRDYVGETTHHPKWALAIKFKPENASTSVEGFEIKMGKTGNFTPVVLLKPVELDGSIVSKTSGYNYKYIIDNKIGVGAIVTLVKSGDIIPQITSVDVPAIETFEMPTVCPHCGSQLEIVNNTHLHCPNDDCEGKKLFKFINSMNVLELDGVGDAFLEELFNKVKQPASFYITNHDDGDVTTDYLIDCGMKEGKILENFVKQLNNLKKLTVEQVISFMSLDGMSIGGKTVKEIAKKLSGVDYSFTGLEKKVVYGWDKNDDDHSKLTTFNNLCEDIVMHGLPIEFVKKREGNIIKLCLTGSPKKFNFSSKGEFIKFLENKEYVVDEVSVKDCDYLVTDDIESKSSKTTTAKKLNKQIVTYDYFN